MTAEINFVESEALDSTMASFVRENANLISLFDMVNNIAGSTEKSWSACEANQRVK